MTLNIVYKAEAPSPPYGCEFVDIRPKVVPFALYGLWLKSQRYFWVTADDWAEARTLLALEGAAYLMPCGRDIVNALDRQYTLLDGVMRGTWREVTGMGTDADPFVYDPVIPQAAQELVPTLGSLQHVAQDTYDAWGNLLDGIASGRWEDTRNIRDMLQAIIDGAGEAGTLDDEMLAALVQIVASLA